jgi:multiple sugar transport system permease protein
MLKTNKIRKVKGRSRNSLSWQIYLLLLPTIFYLLVWTIWPLLYGLGVSLYRYNLIRPDLTKFIGLANYARLFESVVFRNSLRVTVLITVFAVISQLLLAFLIALVLDRRMRGIGVLRTLFIMPVFLSPTVVGLLWRYMYFPERGVVDYLFDQVGLPMVHWVAQTSTAKAGVLIMDAWEWTPFAVLVLLAGIQSVPADIREAADLDGLSIFQYARIILLPMLRPVILVVLLIRMIDTFKTFDSIWNLTRGGPGSSTYMLSIFATQTGLTGGEIGLATAACLFMAVATNIIGFFLVRYLGRQESL